MIDETNLRVEKPDPDTYQYYSKMLNTTIPERFKPQKSDQKNGIHHSRTQGLHQRMELPVYVPIGQQCENIVSQPETSKYMPTL